MNGTPLLPVVASVTAVFLLGLAGTVAGDEAPCDAASLQQGDPVTSEVILEGPDCVVGLTTGLVVAAGGGLEIRSDATLEFHNTDEPVTLTVEDGGSLQISTGGSIRTVDDTGLAILFEPGSVLDWDDATVSGHQTLRVATPTTTMSNVALQDADEALVVVGTTLDAATVQITGAGTALRVEGEGSNVHVEDGAIEGIVAVSAAAGTHVVIKDTTYSGGLELHPTAKVDVDRTLHLQVTPLPDEGDLQVQVRDALDGLRHELGPGPVDASLLLPVESHEGSTATAFAPYRVVAIQGLHATHATAPMDVGASLTLELPEDLDEAVPVWPTASLSHDAPLPGFSTDGSVLLQWLPADDSDVDGIHHPDRAVDHYRVMGDDEILVERTRSTQALLTGLADGVHPLQVVAVDLVGNEAPAPPLSVRVDTVAPTISLEEVPLYDGAALTPEGAAHHGPVNVTVSATDDGSGLGFLRVRVDDGSTRSAEDGTINITLSTAGIHTLHVVAGDQAGNRATLEHNVTVDLSPPLFTARLEPGVGPGGWHREPPVLVVTSHAPGPSGLAAIHWRLGTGEWQAYPDDPGEEPVIDALPGEHQLHVRVTDGADHTAHGALRLAYDPDAPDISLDLEGAPGRDDWFTGPVTIHATAGDSGSGLQRLQYRVAQGLWADVEGPIRLEMSGTHPITARVTDVAGHTAEETVTVRIDARPPTPPRVAWSVLSDGRIRADWTGAPPLDAHSGVAAIAIERSGLGDGAAIVHDVEPDASGHVLSGLPVAEHRLRVVVTDGAGNKDATPWAAVLGGEGEATVLDTVAQVRGVFLLEPDARIRGEQIAEVRYFVDGHLEGAVSTEPFALPWDTKRLDNGHHEVRIVAVDSAGVHHAEVRTYEVRNGYLAAVVDDALASVSAIALGLIGAASAVVTYVRWGREARS